MSFLFKQKKQLKTSERNYSLDELQKNIKEMLLEYTEIMIQYPEMEKELIRNQEEYGRTISDCIRNCCSGHYGARDTVLELIYRLLEEKYIMEQKNIISCIPFDNPTQMTARQQLETMIYFFDKQKENRGFELLCNQFDWNDKEGTISEAKVRQAYMELEMELSTEDKRRIIARIVYAETVGLGVIDTLNAQKGYIEEIQIGMSGRADRQYNYKVALMQKKQEALFCREGVYIMAGGCTIRLSAISFETEEEVQRVLRNLIKNVGGELTKKNPILVADAPDGRRISVSRPPATDTWIGLIRKFDTVREVSLEKLYQGFPEENVIPALLKQLVRSGRNIAITGEMASGKTTLFRACLAEAKKDMNIRVIEAESFELNVRGFLPKVNSVTMRVTEQTPAEEILAFARKTTGQIFAIGEINSASMATMAMDLSKIASQMFFSAHYITTEHMIADFVNAKLCVGGYSEEILAELDVVRCLGFDIHLRVKQGRRYVQCINEVVPKIKRKPGDRTTYEVRPIYQYDEIKEKGVMVNSPSEVTYDRARQQLEKEEYLEFVNFFKI